jgi:glycosyltransferase involved in cell wall biosynthesis
LVLAGAGELKAKGKRLLVVGRLEESEKWDALGGALGVVVPSRYESLSLLTLEAFSVGTPVLGNAACAVVAGHLSRSGAGHPFELTDRGSFANAVKELGENRAVLSARAKDYAAQYRWDRVVAAYLEEIEVIRRH